MPTIPTQYKENNSVTQLNSVIMAKEDQQLSPEQLLVDVTALKNANQEEVAQLLKTQIKEGADFPRTLAFESKSQAPSDRLKFLLEIIFSESIFASEPKPDAENKTNLDLGEIAAKAAENPRFLWAIDGLYHYYCYKRNQNSAPAATSGQYKTLEIKRKELHLHKLETDPYFRSLKWLLETSGLCEDDKGDPSPFLWQTVRIRKAGDDYELIPGHKELNLQADDIILGTLQLVSDIRDKIPATGSYLKKEYQKLSNQAEEFAVALIDEVQDEKDLSAIMKMEDKFSGEDSLIQHAINLRCKFFVVSKNCQHLLKKVVFGEPLYRFWDDPRVKTGTGVPAFLILLMNVFLSSVCAAFMTLLVPLYFVLSLVNLYLTNRKFGRFFEMYERPCQKFLLEVWWFIAFLSLVIITSCENNFIQLKLPSGLTLPDDLLLLFVVAFWIRLLTSLCHRIHTLRTIPRYRRNWRLILPDLLTAVECASLLCFTTAFLLWIVRWNQLDGWRSSDDVFQTVNVFYSLGSLLCFFKLAHYLKVQRTLGTLNLSLYMMITKDVIYFAIIFVILLYVPFATALEKMYSYYVVDNQKNATHPLASYKRTFDDLFWTMMGSDERKDSEISDSDYAYIKQLGEACLAVFTVAAVAVAFNMLVAAMNHRYENIMRNVDVEYVFSRTRMWMEYIAKDHSALPPPLNLADILCFFKCCSQPRNEASQEDESFKKKRNKRISIIKHLVFRYLRRSLGLDNSESSHDILTQNQSSASRRENDIALFVL